MKPFGSDCSYSTPAVAAGVGVTAVASAVDAALRVRVPADSCEFPLTGQDRDIAADLTLLVKEPGSDGRGCWGIVRSGPDGKLADTVSALVTPAVPDVIVLVNVTVPYDWLGGSTHFPRPEWTLTLNVGPTMPNCP